MPIMRPGTSLDLYDVWPLYRVWRWLTFRPLKPYMLIMVRPDPDLTDKLGCNDEFVSVPRLTGASTVTLEVIYTDLLSLHEREYNDEGLINALWGSDLHFVSGFVDATNTARIELSGTLATNEHCAVPRVRQQLTEPAKQIRSGTGFVRRVEIRINDRPLERLL